MNCISSQPRQSSMRASSIFIFFLLLGCGDELDFGCGGGSAECNWSDDCSAKETCKQGQCKREIEPPGPLVEGSQTTRCVKYNDTETGEPRDNLRFNDWCLSGIEKAVECSEPGLWTMVCF